MWADILTKPLQGQKCRDMRAFLQNCPRDYDNDIELQTDQLAQRSDILTKPLQGQKFRDMQAFLQNCPRDYDNDIELQTDQLA